MELKFGKLDGKIIKILGSNCTFMELKCLYPGVLDIKLSF